ncbi:MAG: hypothetical protein LBC65_03415 [Oscillospiraceae bacterium]|nr:hypothetical protein [Oscillospiraceae bacterium]
MSRDLESSLAWHCAAVLLGKKPAALFAKPEAWAHVSCGELQVNGTRFRTFDGRGTRVLQSSGE